MELAEVQNLIDSSFTRLEARINKRLEELEIPDVRNFATKKFLTDSLNDFKTSVTDEFTKTNTAVNKIATDTDTKIAALSTKPKSFSGFKTLMHED